VLGVLIGIFSNLLASDISSDHSDNWKMLYSRYLWILIVLIIIGIIYYWKFSSFIRVRKPINNSQSAANTIIETLVNKIEKMNISDKPITYERMLIIAQKTTQVIHEVDTKLLGGSSHYEQ